MKIECLSKFLDGTDSFEKDDIRTVDEEKGARFVANGWAQDVAGRVATGSASDSATDLTIDKSVIGLGDSNG